MPRPADLDTQRRRDLMFGPGGPENLLRVGPVYLEQETPTSSARGVAEMTTGPWTIGSDGLVQNGAIGVLADDVFGVPVLASHPDGRWAVSVAVSLDFCAPVPTDGSVLVGESLAALVSPTGGLGRGTVTDADGLVVATGSQRLRFVSGTPSPPPDDGSVAATADRQTTMPDLFGIDDGGEYLRLPPRAAHGNPLGNLHGGVLLAFSEVAALRAVQSSAHPLATASVSIAFVRPGSVTDEITFRTETVHRGRTLAVVHVSALRADGRACSVATVTCHAAS